MEGWRPSDEGEVLGEGWVALRRRGWIGGCEGGVRARAQGLRPSQGTWLGHVLR